MKIAPWVSLIGLCIGLAGPLHAAPLSEGAAEETAFFKTLHVFGMGEGYYPSALVLGLDGKMYGAASSGGEYGGGTVFRLHRSGAVDTLFSFGESDSALVDPYGLMAASDGNLYATLRGPIDGNLGGVYRITPRGKMKKLVAFGSKPCWKPFAPLVEATDGLLYGSTNIGGGADSYGCLYRVTPEGAYEQLRALKLSDGQYPVAAMVQASDGFLYGVLGLGGPRGGGTIFRLTLAGDFSVVHAFEACYPQSALVQGPDGGLYGTCLEGGANNLGAVYRFDRASGDVTIVHAFAGATDGSRATSLTLGRDGWLYGATNQGGEHGGGVLYRLALDGTLEVVHPMRPGKKEGQVWAGLLEVSDGVFFGVTLSGGLPAQGSAFRLGVR